MGWPKSWFRFFNINWKNPNKLFDQPNNTVNRVELRKYIVEIKILFKICNSFFK